uniref:Putative reverse transcriptase domain-containing protein n=1 Tax=Tanacetum cinerariifolium TaxID=118510 RepID=A0A6L2KPE9_TANCI|nr:putative reverse transcriptase domain-containing protein [Tanacetum cinerariifolium]
MVKSSSSSKNEVFDDSFCSTSYKKNTESLNTKITKLSEKLSDSKTILTNELEELKKEKEGLESKLTGFESAAKDLDTLLQSQRSDKNKEYKNNSSDLQNSNSSVSEHGESLESIMSKPMIKFVKAADCADVKTNKVKAARKPFVKYAEMYRNTHKSLKFDHLAYNCGLWVEKGQSWPKNNYTYKSMSPRTVFRNTGRTSISKSMEFQVGDRVMLKVLPWKGVVRFGKRGKLNPKYVGPFKVLEKVGSVAYKLELPQEQIHFAEEPVEIMDQEVKRLKRSLSQFSRFDGTLGEVLSSRGNVRINSGRSIRISSQKSHRRQVPRLKP